MEKGYDTLDTEKVFQGRIFEITESRVRLPNGRTTTRLTVRHPGAAVILPLADDGSVILIRQYRHAIGRSILELPAGTLEAGEEPLACAKREIIEEIGFAAADWCELGTLYPAPGFCDELQHLYLARGLTPEIAEGDEDEIIERCSMTVPEVETAILEGQLMDGKSISAFTRARLKGLL